MIRLFLILFLLFLLAQPALAQLVDSGLLVRYYIDEAASGITPSHVLDASGVGSDMDLLINYGAGATDLEYTEVGGNRGLDSKDKAGDQRADFNLASGDKVYDGIHGSQTATVEIKIDADSLNTSTSRIFAINGRTGDAPQLGYTGSSTAVWTTYFNEILIQRFNLGAALSVFHLVIDTTLATANDRLLIYKDGVIQTPLSTPGTITQNATFDLTTAGTNAQLIMLNRESSGSYARSADGILYYAALYDSAFTQANVDTNEAILAVDDDTPTSGPLMVIQ